MKKIISLLLAVIMVASLLPVMALATGGHPENDHTGWEEISALPTDAGNYYLATDVTLTETWTVPTGEVNLCLNDFVIQLGDDATGSVIKVPAGATLNLYDCGISGAITGGNSTNGGGVYVDGGTFNMYGGSIYGNHATDNGGGVFFTGNGSFTLGGNAKIIDNTAGTEGSEVANNVYLQTGGYITLGIGDNAPRDGMSVGVTTQTPPEDSKPAIFIGSGADNDIVAYFTSDKGYTVSVSQSEGKLQFENSYPIRVGGKEVTPSNKGDVLGDDKVSYDPATHTLTLKNANIATGVEPYPSAIDSKLYGDLTIKLVGENQIGAKPANEAVKGNYKVPCGIAASDDNVTITGEGSLTMYTQMNGISADNVDISSEFAGTLTIKNYGEIKTLNGEYISDMPAIHADSNVGIRGGTVNVICHDGGGIYAGEGNIVIEGGATVNIATDQFSGIKAAPGSMEDDGDGGEFYAAGGDVYIYNGAKVTVKAGAKAEELVTDVYGIYAAGCIKIGFEDEIDNDLSEQPPIPAPEKVSVTVGNAKLTGIHDADGIKSENGNTSIIGSKVSVISVNGRGFNIGVCGGPDCGDIIIIDSMVNVDAGTSGIVAYKEDEDCDVTITNSTVSVKAEYWGINAMNDMAIINSTVTAESDIWGIECDTLTVEGARTQISSTGGEVGLVVWGGKNALTVKSGSLKLVGGEMALDVGENPEFAMSLPDGYALKGTREKNVFTDLQNITLKKYKGECEFYGKHTVSFVGNELAKSVALVRNHKSANNNVIEIGTRSLPKVTENEENPETGAPVMNIGSAMVILGAAYAVFKKH